MAPMDDARNPINPVGYSLVQFQDGKRLTNYLVLTKDVQGFRPSSATDIQDKTFMVKWQSSFHDEVADEHHDGCYPAKVLLVGASADELKAKAKELRIKFPSITLSASAQAKPMGKPLRKQRQKKTDIDVRDKNKKERMKETSEFLEKYSSPPSTERSSSVLPHTSTRKKPKSPSKRGISKPSSLERSPKLRVLDKGSSSPKLAKASPCKRRLSEHSSLERSPKVKVLDKGSSSNLKSELDERSSYLESELDGRSSYLKSELDKRALSNPKSELDKRSSSNFKSELLASQSLYQSIKKKPEENCVHESDSESVSTDKDSNDSNVTFTSGPSLSPNRAGNKSIFSQKCDNQYFKPTPPVVEKKTRKVRRLIDSDAETEVATSDEDDTAVLLDKLKGEHKKLQQELAKSKLNESKLMKEIADLRSENFLLQSKLSSCGTNNGGSSPSSSIDDKSSALVFPSSPGLFERESSDLHFDNSSPHVARSSAAKRDQGKNKESKIRDITKQLFTEKKVKDSKKQSPQKNVSANQDEDEFGSGFTGVSKRIEADLRGVKPLQGDDKKVNVGMGLKIAKNAWEKSLRLKSDDSKFLKDSAGLIWGRDALQARTGNRPTASKKACTPKKVHLLHAMLTGKMNARDEDKKQQEFILANMAPKWLTDKCYDSGRPPKTKPKP